MTHLADCHPVFARLFAYVHVFFWPWLWLQLRALAHWHYANGEPDIQVRVTWWGRVRVVAVRDRLPLEAAPRPAIQVPRWAAPALASDVPADILSAFEQDRLCLRLDAPACRAAQRLAPPPAFDTS